MPTPPISRDNTIGPYRLLRKLGEGGMGTVYLAQDDALQRRVAIKVLRIDEKTAASKKAIASRARRFLREARSAARINHPHVVTVYSVGGSAEAAAGNAVPADGQAMRPYLVMEFVEGGSLADFVRKNGPMYWREAAAAVRDALRGLAAAHARAVIHRDIKPANLMLARGAGKGGDAVVKLVDFGLARVVMPEGADAGELTFPGAFIGSPSYSAPEQVVGVATIDGRADLYALAATWYALMAGQPPFVEEDPTVLMERQLREPFPDVRLLAPTVPAPVVDVIARAGQKNPGQRYGGAAEMLAAVEEVLNIPQEDRTAPPPRPPARAKSTSRRAPSPVPPAPSRAEDTVLELENRLALARASSDSTTQLATLRSLYGLYAQLDRPDEASQAFREALVLHVKMHAPGDN